MFQNRIIILLALSILGLQACQDDPNYQELSFHKTAWPPLGYDTYVESHHIIIPSGIVQEVDVDVEYFGDRYLIGSFVDLSSENENVFSVFPMGEKNRFLLVGRTRGMTCMDVVVNGEWEECIPVSVE